MLDKRRGKQALSRAAIHSVHWREGKDSRQSTAITVESVTVGVLQRFAGGNFYRRVISSDGKQVWGTLGTANRDEAVRRAFEFAHMLAKTLRNRGLPSDPPKRGRRSSEVHRDEHSSTQSVPSANVSYGCAQPNLTLRELCERYLDSATFRVLAKPTQDDRRSRLKTVVQGIGPRFLVRRLTREVWNQYREKRSEGGPLRLHEYTSKLSRVSAPKPKTYKPASATTLRADQMALRAMLRWAREELVNGVPLIPSDVKPTFVEEALPVPISKVATTERFVKTLAAFSRRDHSQAVGEYSRYLQEAAAAAFFVLATTGRRAGAVVALRWEDIHFTRLPTGAIEAEVAWHAETDKGRKSVRLPLHTETAEVLWAWKNALKSWVERLKLREGRFVFAAKTREGHLSTDQLANQVVAAESFAELPKLERTVLHAYRRRFGTALRADPVTAMRLMGLRNYDVYRNSYARPDDEVHRKALNTIEVSLGGPDGVDR